MVEQHAADILQPFLDQLREARTAVANGDPEPMKALCSTAMTSASAGSGAASKAAGRKSVNDGTGWRRSSCQVRVTSRATPPS
jgi:hypothetical protein